MWLPSNSSTVFVLRLILLRGKIILRVSSRILPCQGGERFQNTFVMMKFWWLCSRQPHPMLGRGLARTYCQQRARAIYVLQNIGSVWQNDIFQYYFRDGFRTDMPSIWSRIYYLYQWPTSSNLQKYGTFPSQKPNPFQLIPRIWLVHGCVKNSKKQILQNFQGIIWAKDFAKECNIRHCVKLTP